MRRSLLLGFLIVFASFIPPGAVKVTGNSNPDLGWLFLDEGPYTLVTHVEARPGDASFVLVKDLSLMDPVQDTVLNTQVTVAADSMIRVDLGSLAPGFYQVRLRDSLRWNIGVRPDDVVSPPDHPKDFDKFWKKTFRELDMVPLSPEFKVIPSYSNELRTCYEVRYTSWGGAVSGGILSIPNAPGKYPAQIMFMGYGAEPYYIDPSSSPEQIQFLVSVRDQGIFKAGQDRWIDRGIEDKESFYYRGAFCDVKRAVDFVAALDKADPERMVAWGESQGGAFTFLAAAIDKRIKAIAPSVPFMGDYRDYARIVWWPVHEVFGEADASGLPREKVLQMLRYFDIKNFAPKVKCPVYMSFGLQDPTCPPHTNFAIYNNLGTCEKRFLCVPTCDHAMWKEPLWDKERAAFLEAAIR